MHKYLVIVESPSKAKTLSKILSSEYKVLASYGHIMDLPKNSLGFDPSNDFKPEYKVTDDKRRVVAEIKRSINRDTIVYLAPDDDREGTIIAKHLLDVLKLDKSKYRRIVFHEITKSAILHAIDNPVELDFNLADAAMARRIMDRAVGYKLSPLLWKKIKYGLSAGRVQSVATRIVVDREKEINAFIKEEFWKLKLDIMSNPNFKAEFNKHNGKVIRIENEEQATNIKRECDSSDYILNNAEEKDSYRTPPPAFTTSTLQQEASTKAGLSPKQTMMIAQKLYEGSVNIPNHTGGLITYMRTDSINLSQLATDASKKVIIAEYGSEYALAIPRVYKTKGNNKVAAQEAHEAIRPVNMSLKPSDIVGYLDHKEHKLYTLIWQRTLATQMQAAKVSNTTYKIYGGPNKEYEFVAKGTKILFPGFMKAYTEGDDTDSALDNKEKFLPNVAVGTVFKETKLTTEQNFTKPPSRYTEAGLIKKMEQEGVGRPSTYASTLSTITTRGYVEIDPDKKLVPTMIGTVVTDYLIENFPEIVDLAFTANIESEFDKIAQGEIKWETVLHNFYDDFDKNVTSKNGGERVQFSETRIVGVDKESGLDIQVKSGQYGNYIQIGNADKEKKIKPLKISPIPKHKRLEDVTYEDALYYLRVPRKLGEYNGKVVNVGIGRFGPFISTDQKYYTVKVDDDVYTIELPRAIEIIKEIDAERSKALILDFPNEDIKVLMGTYGLYIKSGKNNYKLPKGMEEDDVRKLTLDKVKEIIKNQPAGGGKKFKSKK